jgi:hypothetical protein
MPAHSEDQAKLMRLVRAAQKGKVKGITDPAKTMAKDMDVEDVEDMMTTEDLYKLKEYIRGIVREMNTTANVQGYLTPKAFSKPGSEKKKAKKQASLTGYTVVEEINQLAENRWLELKKEELPARAKIGRGISNINKQLNEIERFLNWYGRLKQENGMSNQDFWKRTNHNIYKIKERLIKLEQQLRKISE